MEELENEYEVLKELEVESESSERVNPALLGIAITGLIVRDELRSNEQDPPTITTKLVDAMIKTIEKAHNRIVEDKA